MNLKSSTNLFEKVEDMIEVINVMNVKHSELYYKME